MDAAVQSYIFQPSIIAQLLAGTAAMTAFAFGVAAVVPKISKVLIPKPKATRLGDHIKFKSMHKDRKTIICEDNVHAVIVNFAGIDLRFNEPARQRALNNARQVWVEQMNDLGIRMRLFFVRDRLPKGSDYKHSHGIMDKVASAWNKGLPRALSTEFYAVLSVKDATKAVLRLDEALEQTKSIMADYRPSELIDNLEVAETSADAPRIDQREETMTPAAFFSRMLSPLSRPVPIGQREKGLPLSYRMTTDNVRYDSELGMFEFSNGPERKYAAVFVIEEWTSPMLESHMLELLSYPVEMTICHDINPIGKGAAMATLRWQEKMAPGLQPGSDAATQFSTVAQAIERGSEEEQELAQVQSTITIYGDTPEEVLAGRSMINQLKMVGITPVWPKHTMVQHWFGHFPGFDSMARPQRLLSGEISILATFQHTPTGKLRSDWGEGPIAMFETIDGSPYAFNFHVGEGSPPLGHCVVIGPSGQGKAQPLDAAILTPTGWSTMGEMKVGKLVRAPDGKVARVTGVYPQGFKDNYVIEFEDGRQVEACDEHLWKIWNPGNARYEVLPLKDVQKLHEKMKSKGRNISVPLMDMDAAHLPEVHLDLPAYFMGVYLGDGGTATGSLIISTAEPEHTLERIVSEIPDYKFNSVSEGSVDHRMVMVDRSVMKAHDGYNGEREKIFNSRGFEVVDFEGQKFGLGEISEKHGLYHQLVRSRLNRGWNLNQALGLDDVTSREYKDNPVKEKLKKLGIYGLKSDEKFIPEVYLEGSYEQRLALMQGLMDTDGGVENDGTKASFTSTSERMARQVQKLAWSLGAIASVASRTTSYTDKNGEKKQGKMSWRVSIRAEDISKFFSLPRKVEACRKANVEIRLNIKSIRFDGKKEMQCISIDHADKLYITNDYVVTHNTTIVTFLAAMALRHPDLKAFFFDRGRGCEVITRALHGSYIFFNGQEGSAGLNPMQLDDTPQNRTFLKEWLELIGDVKPDEYRYQEEVTDAIEINFDPNLTHEQRNLQQLYNAVFPADSDMRNRLLAWTNPNQWGPLVCAKEDTLDISQRVAGFDFTEVLTNDRLGPAMVSYIMHRILAEAKAQPRLIFIDETEPLLRNENFRLRFKKLLQEGRKERQVIISAFQRPQAPDEVGVGDTIRGQCPTVFFFRNPQAEEKDYEDWRLTPRELDFVLGKSYRKKKYAVLVKRYTENGESIILNTDLSTLGQYMKIFHSGRQNVLHMEEMVKQFPDDYVQQYLATAAA